MRRFRIILVAVAIVASARVALAQPTARTVGLTQSLRFEENKGQVASTTGEVQNDILYILRDRGMNVYFRNDGISYQWYYTEDLLDGSNKISEATGLPMTDSEVDLPEKFKQPTPSILHTYRVDMQWLGANQGVEILNEQPYEDYTNYYLGHCPDGITGVKSYAKLTYKNIYPGIDVQYYIKDGHLKYDVLVAAGADLSSVQFTYAGATPKLMDGKVKLLTTLGWLEELQPVSWNEEGKAIEINYSIENGRIGFGNHKAERAFIIDPGLVWSTYYVGNASGSTGADWGYSVSVDGSGNVYLGGRTWSAIGIAMGGHQNTKNTNLPDEAFLAKFNSSGIRLWATYYGGDGVDQIQSTAVDGLNNVYAAGRTTSKSAIAFNGHQNIYSGVDQGGTSDDAFLVKFSSDGLRIWATYYGGTGLEDGFKTEVDGSNNVYLAGETTSSSGIAFGGHQNSLSGTPGLDSDAFLVKFSSSGARVWATYYGGNENDKAESIDVDVSGNVYMVGETKSTSGIASGGHQNTFGGGDRDAFLVKFSSSGIRQWATYYGGTLRDVGNSTSVDGSGNVYLAGDAASSSGIAAGGHDNTLSGASESFLVKFNTSGIRQWATYYGGGSSSGKTTTTDDSGNIFLGGQAGNNGEVAFSGYQNTFGGDAYDAYLAKFNSSGVRVWGTYFGGTLFETANSSAVDGQGNIYLCGETRSKNAIALNGHQNVSDDGGVTAFLAKFSDSSTLSPEPSTQPTNLVFSSVTATSLTVSYVAATGSPAGYIAIRKSGSAPTSNPVDGTTYTAGGTLGDGDIAYVGGAGTFNQTGLTGSTAYHYKIYSYNGSGGTINYRQTSPLTGNQTTAAGGTTEPTAQPTNLLFTSVTSVSMTVSYTAATGSPAGYIAVFKSGSAPTTDPVDGTAYTAGGTLGDGAIAYAGGAITFNQTGLTGSTIYHYKIYSYNGSGGTINYRQTSPLTGNQTTAAGATTEPAAQPTNLLFSSATATSTTVSYTAATGSPAGYIAVRKAGSAPTTDPVDGTAYTQDGTLGDGIIAYVGSAVTFNQTGLTASTVYHYKIYSYNGAGSAINYRQTSPLTGSQATSAPGADTTPPQAGSNTTPANVSSGSAIAVSVVISDPESGVTNALISYGPATSSNFATSTVPMTNTSGTWTFSIPSSAQSDLGVRYKIVTSNGVGLNTTIGPLTVGVTYSGTGVNIPYTTFGSAVSNYRIIAIPLTIANKTVNGIFGDNLGNYGDKSKWRMFQYSTGQMRELTGATSLEPGFGYWLIATENKALDTGPGQTSGGFDNPVAVPVTQGWNQIGNPYGFNLAWSDIKNGNSVLGLGNLRVYRTGSGFADATALKISEGAFVFANTAGTLTFPAVKNASVNGRQSEYPTPLRLNSLDAEDWEVRFTLQSETLVNDLGGVGMHPDASTDFDAFDDFTLPRFGDYLELNHGKKLYGSSFTRDIVSPAQTFSWQFQVDVAEPAPVTLRWSNLHLQGSVKKLVLWDVDAHMPVNMEQVTEYKFKAPGRFTVYYGNDDYHREQSGKLRMMLYAPSPNPSSGDVEVNVWIPSAGFYALEMIDLSGRVVHSWLHDEVDAGFHRFLWQRTEPVERGLYLIKLSDGREVVHQKLLIH